MGWSVATSPVKGLLCVGYLSTCRIDVSLLSSLGSCFYDYSLNCAQCLIPKSSRLGEAMSRRMMSLMSGMAVLLGLRVNPEDCEELLLMVERRDKRIFSTGCAGIRNAAV